MHIDYSQVGKYEVCCSLDREYLAANELVGVVFDVVGRLC